MKRFKIYFGLAILSFYLMVTGLGIQFNYVFSSGITVTNTGSARAASLLSQILLNEAVALTVFLIFGGLAFHFKPQNLGEQWGSKQQLLWLNIVLPYFLLVAGEVNAYVNAMKMQANVGANGFLGMGLMWPFSAGLLVLMIQLIGFAVSYAYRTLHRSGFPALWKVILVDFLYLILLIFVAIVYKSFMFVMLYLSFPFAVVIAIIVPFLVIPLISIIKLMHLRRPKMTEAHHE